MNLGASLLPQVDVAGKVRVLQHNRRALSRRDTVKARYRAEKADMAKGPAKRVTAKESFNNMCTLLGDVGER